MDELRRQLGELLEEVASLRRQLEERDAPGATAGLSTVLCDGPHVNDDNAGGPGS